MSKFVCNNNDCPRFRIEDDCPTNTYRLINGHMISDNAECPVCGFIREEISNNKDIPIDEKNLSIGEFQSMSIEQKRESLKKRSHSHYDKEIKPYKDFKINEAVSQFNDASKK